MSPVMEQKSFALRGNIQKVMFRQTFIRALIKRGLKGGASNHPNDKKLVHTSIEGDQKAIESLIRDLLSLPKLNSWGAKVDESDELENFIPIKDHQVTTSNVDDFAWNPSVIFYL
jgi:acylphosphatase